VPDPERNHILADSDIGALLWRLSIPAMVGMGVMATYNLVDAIFIGRGIGTLGIAGLAICFPVQLIVMAVGQLLGMGGASIISRSTACPGASCWAISTVPSRRSGRAPRYSWHRPRPLSRSGRIISRASPGPPRTPKKPPIGMAGRSHRHCRRTIRRVLRAGTVRSMYGPPSTGRRLPHSWSKPRALSGHGSTTCC